MSRLYVSGILTLLLHNVKIFSLPLYCVSNFIIDTKDHCDHISIKLIGMIIDLSQKGSCLKDECMELNTTQEVASSLVTE